MSISIVYTALQPECREIRQEVFVDEQGFTDEFDEQDGRSLHVLVMNEDGTRAVATGRVFEDGDAWHIGRLAVRKEYRGKGVGKTALKALEEAAFKRGASRIILGSQDHARGFYEKQGYHVCGDSFYEQDALHWPMEKTRDQA